LEYDGIFDAATVLTDHKPNGDCFVASEQWKWKRQQINVTIVSRCCQTEKPLQSALSQFEIVNH